MSSSQGMRPVLAVLFATVVMIGGGATAAASPAPTADPAQSAAPGVRDVDWHDATLPLPPVGSCPRNTVDFTDGEGRVDDSIYRFTPDREIHYADVTGEGVTDALIFMDCGPPASEYSTSLIGMTTRADGTVRALGTVVSTGVWTHQPTDVAVHGGLMAVTITDIETDRTWIQYYRWAASARAFVRVG
ncbi:hypothetical protein FHX42_001020 [Saccharopolyspora lacisalsi]|uniref:Uncharacterized protein n=1 Tax=Halosaccharopolyspora lacisalsi TaxID=1000566 RepID=A0A839DWW6_9PSEU|nr:hypothetical protein [Halosaccharopolyspora lacisalsi]MBA8823691.1 hypothetical protein [Halosaccharopolyspora lacisalsi]